MSRWLLRNHVALFIGVNVLMDLALLIMAPMHGAAAGQVLYVGVLFGLCTAPLVPMASFNGRYSLLLIFMFTYFMHFGGLDAQLVLLGQGMGQGPGTDPQLIRTSLLLPAEMLVLACGVLLLLGYLGVARARRSAAAAAPAEWSAGMMLVVGLSLWSVGTAAEIYLGVFVVPESTTRAVAKGFASLGSVGTFTLMLARLMQPLGLLILAYAYARFRGSFWTALIIAIVTAQAVAGFIATVKTTALMGVVVVVVTRLLVDNGPPLKWVASALIAVALAFPVFQANRMEVTGARGLNHLQALQGIIGRVLQIAVASRDKVNDVRLEARPPTIVERVYIKNNLEQVMDHVGVDVPYLNGASLQEVAFAFVPRLIIADKQSISMGQLFTHQIAHSDTDTFISISHLGELYWNFGWLGTLMGVLLTGVILGTVGSLSSLEAGPSLTQVMILLITVQSLCIGFEGELSISYVTWMRSLAAVGLLHLLFARRTAASVDSPAPSGVVMPTLPVRFPNLMR